MNWKNFVDRFGPMTCILSVEKKPDGRYGAIRIVTGNEAYLDSLALAAGGLDLDSDQKTEFVPNSEYTRYIPKDLNFEEVCYRCAVLKQPIHNFLRASRYSFDMNVYMLPIEEGEESDEQGGKQGADVGAEGCEGDGQNLAYCTFTQVLLQQSDDNMTSMNISRKTATDVISTCIKLRGDKPFQEIMQEVIEDIRNICDAEFCCVMLMDENQRGCTILGETRAPGSSQKWMEECMDEDFYDLAETWLDTLDGSYCLVIDDEKDMEYIRQRNPVWYQSLTDADVQRLVIFPLFSRGRFLGYIWATNFDAEETLHIKDTLELTTYFIASEIANNRYIDQLQMLSKIDMLTGVMNRNAMNNRVEELCAAAKETPCGKGIVFVDMNDLKQVNDHYGHMAGDQLLKNAAMVLQSTFTGDEIYRVGGDEFLVLLHETDQGDMEQKIEEIKQKSEMFDKLSFAAGCSSLSSDRDIRRALSEADERMYEDKKRYHSQFAGEVRWQTES